MATKKGQRIGIWVIAVVMVIGTLGSFFVVILANDNENVDQARLQTAQEEYQKNTEEYQAKVQAQADQLSPQYFGELSQYSSRVSAFSPDGITELRSEDLKVGDGAEITKDSTFTAYYIGWNPSGEVFDQSIDGEKLKAPFEVTPGGVITGWTEGAVGMKVGGIRELTIPSEKAYGAQGSGEKIPANTPLKFVIYIVPTPEKINQPAVPQELIDAYGGQ